MALTSLVRKSACCLALLLVGICAARAEAQEVVVEGLAAPSRMLAFEGGYLLVAENGTAPNTGRVSLVTPHGLRRTLIDGLPAGIGPEGGPSGPSGLALDGRTLYVTIGAGDGVSPGPAPGTEVPNPNPASPILSSVLAFTLVEAPDKMLDPITLTLRDHHALKAGHRLFLGRAKRSLVTVRLLADFPNYTANPIPGVPDNVRASNPYGVTVYNGRIFVADASQNKIVEIRPWTSTVATLVTFAPIANPLPFGPPFIDYVPDSVRTSASGLLVTNLVGFPFPPGTATVRRVDPNTGASTVLISNLTSAIDVLPVGSGLGESYFVLEHSTNMLGSAPGRVLYFEEPDDEPVVVADYLIGPTGLAYDASGEDLYIAEMFTGRVLRVSLSK